MLVLVGWARLRVITTSLWQVRKSSRPLPLGSSPFSGVLPARKENTLDVDGVGGKRVERGGVLVQGVFLVGS